MQPSIHPSIDWMALKHIVVAILIAYGYWTLTRGTRKLIKQTTCSLQLATCCNLCRCLYATEDNTTPANENVIPRLRLLRGVAKNIEAYLQVIRLKQSLIWTRILTLPLMPHTD